ncbi:DinB family protein [Ichthyenterobacterium magnum]|uniref:DinB family protein n=1 Tax=Ichthyenterobacterium magnum TaxID=1230530 RepID=A0A420DXP8_9FLAO|nr:DinB family protein [Ichthyenterobacterium magnum]RKE98977.1 DinB family protein [Ichthyenterobacterium magnum]
MTYTIKNALEILKQTPKTLKSFLVNLSDDWIYCNEGNDTWSAFDIVGHLIHGEKTDWIPRLEIIMNASENKTFTPYNRFAQFEDSKGKTLAELLAEFSELRKNNIIYLKSLNLFEEQLDLKGIHPELGEVTLRQLLASWVTHDLGHMAQIARVMAKQYKNEVGPWAAYITILNK